MQFVSSNTLALGAQFHQFLLNHGVACIPPGVFILSSAMSKTEIDQLLGVAQAAFREIS
jgi:glutamate-1-semialdehyde aminotransferase